MKLVFDEKACEKNGITLNELIALLVIHHDVDIGKEWESLVSKGMISEFLAEGKKNVKYGIAGKGANAVNNSVIDSFDYTESEDNRLENLAKKLQEVYPTGRKEGTSYMWRGTVAELVRKLKVLQSKYKFKFTDEQAINATKAYVQSFNGNYRYMQLLKYFLLKTVRDEDSNVDIKSEFMSLIENENQVNLQREEWTSTLI